MVAALLGVASSLPAIPPQLTQYRIIVASCGTAQLQPILLSVTGHGDGRDGAHVQGFLSVVPGTTSTLADFGDAVSTVGTASKWVVRHPTRDIVVSQDGGPSCTRVCTVCVCACVCVEECVEECGGINRCVLGVGWLACVCLRV